MDKFQGSTRIELQGRLNTCPFLESKQLLTVKSAVDLPIVNGNQIPKPMVVSRMKVIRMA